jgi:ankyrin repeat protein
VRLTWLVLVVLVAACGGDDSRQEDARLVRAATRGDLESVMRLLAGGADVDSQDTEGRTAVTAAVYGGHLEVVRALIDGGADVDIQDSSRANALLATGETGNAEILRAVLRADPDLTRTNRFGGTALIPAADRGHVDVVRELVKTEIDLDHVNDVGWTALLEAVILGNGGAAHQQIVRILVDAGADVDIADRDGVPPLEHARRNGYDQIARILATADGTT